MNYSILTWLGGYDEFPCSCKCAYTNFVGFFVRTYDRCLRQHHTRPTNANLNTSPDQHSNATANIHTNTHLHHYAHTVTNSVAHANPARRGSCDCFLIQPGWRL